MKANLRSIVNFSLEVNTGLKILFLCPVKLSKWASEYEGVSTETF
jgi:hypothetical protein